MQLKINVTQENIRDGIKRDCESCPIALALRPIFDPNLKVEVEPTQAVLYCTPSLFDSFELPEEAQEFIKAYDSNLEVKPFSFYVDIPEEFLPDDYLESRRIHDTWAEHRGEV